MQAKLKTIIIFCADVEKLSNFYKDNFGFAAIGLPDKNWTVLNAGETQIAFHKMGEQFLAVPPEQFKIEGSNIKLVFEINTDIAVFRKYLLDKGIIIGEVKRFQGFPYAVCDGNDPEGNVFQVMQKLP